LKVLAFRVRSIVLTDYENTTLNHTLLFETSIIRMESVTFRNSRATWDGSRLTLQNLHFQREYLLNSGSFRLVSWRVGERFYLADDSPKTESSDEQLSVFSATEREDLPVEEPFLEVTLGTPFSCFQFRLWDDIAGLAFRTVSNVPQESTENVFEQYLMPRGHFRLTQAVLHAQSDHHAELVQENDWLLYNNETDLRLSGNAFALEDVLTSEGHVFFKHAALPEERTISTAWDLRVREGEHLAFADGGNWCGVISYTQGHAGRCAEIQRYSRQWRRYESTRDGLFLTNTWGDRSADSHVSGPFMAAEIEAAARLGADIVQIDDGWQQGVTDSFVSDDISTWKSTWEVDPGFWEINSQRFPEGLETLVRQAGEKGLRFGLWFAPDSTNDLFNWRRDADAILRRHHELGIEFFKIDAVLLDKPQSETNLRSLFEAVLRESGGRVTLDIDITAGKRLGPLGVLEPGPLFVENRYTHFRRYWPHHTLRVAWQLTHWIDPVRLRLEWLNVTRNTEQYEGDPLAPSRWQSDTLFATTMYFAPLGWFEVQNLPESYFTTAAPLIATWKQHRTALQSGTIVPIGSAPDGVAWTGFVSTCEEHAYVLAFRELNPSPSWELILPQWSHADAQVEMLGGKGSAVWRDGRLHFTVPEELGFVWFKVTAMTTL
jgi:alpha-galactosidase